MPRQMPGSGYTSLWHPYNVAKLDVSTILFAAKTSGKTRLVQYVITAKNLFKTSIAILIISYYRIFKKYIYHKIFIWQPYSLPQDSLVVGVWAQFFSQYRYVITV